MSKSHQNMLLPFKAVIRNIKQSQSNHIIIFPSYREITQRDTFALFFLIRVLKRGNFNALYFSSLKCLQSAPILKQVATSSCTTVTLASIYVL